MPWPRIVLGCGHGGRADGGHARRGTPERAGKNQVMGELQFSGATKVERESGVWIDGQYVGL